jgi:hypothetical protein
MSLQWSCAANVRIRVPAAQNRRPSKGHQGSALEVESDIPMQLRRSWKLANWITRLIRDLSFVKEPSQSC